LYSNAIKFTQNGTVKISVSIENDEFLKIQIIDTGIGISDENQKNLFKLFGFIKNTSDKTTNGIGLGLMISKQLVLQYDGSIHCESEFGIGSKFTFRVKL
jgi:signal transduction histidine kinase